MVKKQVLGRGFEGLIPTGMDLNEVTSPGEHIKNVVVDKIVVNPDQPRKEFDQAALQELANSITQHGIIQPLVVTPQKDKYKIVAGERRYRAAQIAGLSKIPVIVRNHKELEELEIALVENVQRVDLSPLEQALSIVRLRDQFSMSVADISTKLGKAQSTVINIVRLLQLPEEAVTALQKNEISEGHARAILALKTDEKLQKELLNNIITQKWSVRAAEEYVKNKKTEQGNKEKAIVAKEILVRVGRIKKKLGLPAKITTRKLGGIVQINYSNEKQLSDLLDQLEK